jgi:hypothetical protein
MFGKILNINPLELSDEEHRSLLSEHGVLVFRDHELSYDHQKTVMEKYGKLQDWREQKAPWHSAVGDNIVNLHRIIKIYASQKLEQYQLTPTPPILPNISNSNGTVLETINYSNGTKIIVFKDNDKKFTALIDGNNKHA